MTPYHKKFLVRSREMWYIAKEDPHGIVHISTARGVLLFGDVPQIAAYHKKLFSCTLNTHTPYKSNNHSGTPYSPDHTEDSDPYREYHP